ncbi:MAG: hypothetical protein CMG74_00300 [Candidatus Marinimicrobia bacterium]|mgnify:CR=1 FL=1|nr:hypothetical protein [Candidatus Neomarinimicrobiota bacterium]|tara:strand:+ start:286 stop:900 length:615 start_codon:yes stop_codon:yes gene_type:complete
MRRIKILYNKIGIKKTKILILFFCLYTIYNCTVPAYEKLSVEDPGLLLSIKDSLIDKHGKKQSLIESFVRAHNALGLSEMKRQNYYAAVDHFILSQELISSDTAAIYNMIMAEGHILYMKGSKNGLWNAVEKYSKAAQLYTNLGDPYYYMGLTYQKLGDKDFDLILESYNNALMRTLTDKKRNEVEIAKKIALNRQNKLKQFWR